MVLRTSSFLKSAFARRIIFSRMLLTEERSKDVITIFELEIDCLRNHKILACSSLKTQDLAPSDMSDKLSILKIYQPLSEEEFYTLECTITSTPAPTEVKLLGKLTRASGINNNQLKDFLKTAEIAYDNQEWTKCAQLLGMLIANRIGPVSSKGRFAVAAILAGAIDEAYSCAKECIEVEPRESSSYLAIAIICTHLGLLTQALRWLKLAEMASSTTSSLHRELKSRIEHDWADYTIGDSVAKIRENSDMLSQELEHNAALAMLSRFMVAHPGRIVARDFSDDCDYMRQPQSAFHRLDLNCVLRVARFIEVKDSANLRETCKLFENWLDRPQFWMQLEGMDLSEFDWNVPRTDSTSKLSFCMWYISKGILEDIADAYKEHGPVGHIKRHMEIVAKRDHLLRYTTPAESLNYSNDIIFRSIIPVSEREETFRTPPEVASKLLAASAIQFCTIGSCIRGEALEPTFEYLTHQVLHHGEPVARRLDEEFGLLSVLHSHLEGPNQAAACILISAIKAAKHIHPLKPMSISMTEDVRIPRDRFSGAWHFFITPLCSEEDLKVYDGIMNINYAGFGEPMENPEPNVTGHGADSFGSFVLSAEESFISTSRAVKLTFEYSNGSYAIFEGVFTPWVIGGTVTSAGEDGEDAPLATFVGVRSRLAEFQDETHVNQLIEQRTKEAKAVKPSEVPKLTLSSTSFSRKRDLLRRELFGLSKSVDSFYPTDELKDYWEEMKERGMDFERVEQEVLRNPPDLEMGTNETVSKFQLRQKLFVACSEIVKTVRLSLLQERLDMFAADQAAIRDSKNHRQPQEVILKWQRLLEWSPLTPNLVADPSKGMAAFLVGMTMQVYQILSDVAEREREERVEGLDDRDLVDLHDLDDGSDDSGLYDSDSDMETLGQTLRRVGGRAKKSHSNSGMFTQNLVIIGSVAAAVVSVVGAVVLGYMFSRKRN